METQFTPLSALAGGAFIGAAALVLFLGLGRIAGVSGMVVGAIRRSAPISERAWRLAFLAGLLVGPFAAAAAMRQPLIHPSPAGLPVLLVAGLAVGVGTGLANGCTSGHGVCGVARWSRRSLFATATFMGFGVLTASLLRHAFIG